eukprot:75830-Pleurochrysis_carterae.AAC.1
MSAEPRDRFLLSLLQPPPPFRSPPRLQPRPLLAGLFRSDRLLCESGMVSGTGSIWSGYRRFSSRREETAMRTT